MLHINTIMLLVNTTISHVNIHVIMLFVDIIYLACRGQRHANIDFYIYIFGLQYIMFRYLEIVFIISIKTFHYLFHGSLTTVSVRLGILVYTLTPKQLMENNAQRLLR